MLAKGGRDHDVLNEKSVINENDLIVKYAVGNDECFFFASTRGSIGLYLQLDCFHAAKHAIAHEELFELLSTTEH